jgi:hypothetical protein
VIEPNIMLQSVVSTSIRTLIQQTELFITYNRVWRNKAVAHVSSSKRSYIFGESSLILLPINGESSNAKLW